MGIETPVSNPDTSTEDRARRISEGHKNFQELLKNPEKLKELTRGSHFEHEGTAEEAYKSWKKNREAIVQAIDKDGSIFDLGCANGFLLRCLQEWSSKDLKVYGNDYDHELIENAKELFKDDADNFSSKDLLEQISEDKLPKFDYVYWNVWDNWIEEEEVTETKYFKPLLDILKEGGKLILGLYHEDAEENLKVIKELDSKGVPIEKVIFGPSGNAFVVLKK